MLYDVENIDIDIFIEPKHIDIEYKETLFKKIVKKYEGKAVDNIGIIKKVNKINKIYKHKIVDNSIYIYFFLNIEIIRYLPKIGNICKLKINKIFPYGLFFIQEHIRILVPANSINKEKYKIENDNEEQNMYLINNEKKIIYTIGSEIEIELFEIRFEKEGFNCLAKII
tara:strand:- start:528 stop:1034 length:507 start_codon:yes stop_codon:yes gene_type:complete